MIPPAAIERDVLILTCAISAGIHAALVPEHFAEGAGAGGGFVASVVLLAGLLAVLLTLPAADRLDFIRGERCPLGTAHQLRSRGDDRCSGSTPGRRAG